MGSFTLNGKKMKTRGEAYEHIAETLGFPEYFGKNLDALYDLLTEMSGDVSMKNADDMINALGGYGCEIVKCFCDAAEQNPNFSFRIK